MGNRFASGKWAIAQCDRCDGRYKLKDLRREVIKGRNYELLVCQECWDPDQPQLSLGMYPVYDPQSVMQPRPDVSYKASGTSGLQIALTNGNSVDADGYQEEGSRVFQWGWYPVGGSSANDAGLTPNNLVLNFQLASVTISTI